MSAGWGEVVCAAQQSLGTQTPQVGMPPTVVIPPVRTPSHRVWQALRATLRMPVCVMMAEGDIALETKLADNLEKVGVVGEDACSALRDGHC